MITIIQYDNTDDDADDEGGEDHDDNDDEGWERELKWGRQQIR